MTKSYNKKKKAVMIEALQKTLGVISTACELAEISRDTHYRWMNEDEEYKREAEDTTDLAIDFAVSALHKQIAEGNHVSTIFLLKTLGKKRGYVERVETTGANGAPIEMKNMVIKVKTPYLKEDDD